MTDDSNTKQPGPSEWHLTVPDPTVKPSRLLSDESGLSIGEIKQAMQKGAVWIGTGDPDQDSRHVRRLRRQGKYAREGDELHLYYDPKVLNADIPEPQLIADLEQYSVWYKPFGILSQGSKWGDHGTIARWAEQHLPNNRPAFVVHRLDRAATGLMLLAHSKTMATKLSRAFAERDIDKRYQVIVQGKFPNKPEGWRIEAPIDDHEAVSIAYRRDFDAQHKQTLLEVQIETGRKHQIRRHLAEIGFPVVGDRLYGKAEAEDLDLQLCASHLSFNCPVTEQPRRFDLTPKRLLRFPAVSESNPA